LLGQGGGVAAWDGVARADRLFRVGLVNVSRMAYDACARDPTPVAGLVDALELCELLAATAPADYDCRLCGACCVPFHEEPGYVLLAPGEADACRWLGLPVLDADGSLYLGTRPHEGRGIGRACVAFEGSVGTPSGCAVYAERPGRCRDFEMGSARCRFARLQAGLPI
jgi:uncharacterized protein